MGVETIGKALSLGWRVTARCAHGREDDFAKLKIKLFVHLTKGFTRLFTMYDRRWDSWGHGRDR